MRYRLRKLLQFRLGTLLLVITVLSVWLGIQVNRANRQRRALAAIEAARGVVSFDYERDSNFNRIPNAEPPGPKWLRKLVGDEYFRKVVTVDFATEFYGRRKEQGLSKVDDEGLQCLESLPDIEGLELGHNRAVTDAGLVHLRSLNKLRVLWLYDCSVTGTGLVHLANLPELGVLDLRWCPVTHEGLIGLGKLKQLETLSLAGTPIKNEDLPALEPLASLGRLYIDNTSITDEGLPHLKLLRNLRSLSIDCTGITDDGLTHLESLVGLEELTLPGSISEEAMKELQQALPNCRVLRVRSR